MLVYVVAALALVCESLAVSQFGQRLVNLTSQLDIQTQVCQDRCMSFSSLIPLATASLA